MVMDKNYHPMVNKKVGLNGDGIQDLLLDANTQGSYYWWGKMFVSELHYHNLLSRILFEISVSGNRC
jgi:hypothetical protein